MEIIEIGGSPQSLTQRQRWSLYLVYAFGLMALVIGMNLRDSALYATLTFTDSQAGIRAAYPENWLIDTSGDYVLRVRDLSTYGFKTTIQVALLPINPGVTDERNVLDALTLSRSQTLSSYTVQSVEPYTLPDESVGVRMDYTFVSVGENPFLASVPVVVQGVDILVNRRGQALVITFQSDVTAYERNFSIFERFLRSLES